MQRTDGCKAATLEPMEPRRLLTGGPVADAAASSVAAMLRQAGIHPLRHELVLIDSDDPHFQQLIAAAQREDSPTRQVQVAVLDSSHDGLAQLSAILGKSSSHEFNDVYFVSHASDGELKLGSTWLNEGDLPRYQKQLASLGKSLVDGGDLLFYGCDLASGVDGKAFVRHIAQITGANVAASTDLTGSAQLGGNWTLEFQIGTITAPPVFPSQVQSNWDGLLATFTVTNPADSGAGSLRAAITTANAVGGGTIDFSIPASGVQTISLDSALPSIIQPVTIDGTSESGYAGAPLIELDGSNADGGANGLTLVRGSSGSTIRGLVIHSFSGAGIDLNQSSNNTISSNCIGTNAAGTAASGNGSYGVMLEAGSSNNQIGGTAAGDANIIAGNSQQGVVVTGSGSTGNAIETNSIWGNGTLGIDLNNDGVTTNSGSTNAALANNGMNTPVFTSAGLSGSTLTLSGYVGSAANQATFAGSRVEVFTANPNTSGFGQGQSYLGYLTTDNQGNFAGSLMVTGLNAGTYLTGTATNSGGNTSEFSPDFVSDTSPTVAVAASANPSPVNSTTTNLNVLGADSLGESNLTYTWATIGTLPATVTFSANGTNAAKNSTATFAKAGSYSLQVTVSNPSGLSATSTVNVTVSQNATKVIIINPPPAVAEHETYSFSASLLDQFGNPMASQPAFNWLMDTGGTGSTLSSTGVYSTENASPGTDTIHAVASNGMMTSISVSVTTDGIFAGGVDVGPPALPGYFSYNNGTYTVTGGDNGNSTTNDQFQFADSSLAGDVQLVARISFLTSVGATAIGGLVLRDGTGESVISAAVYMLSNNTVSFQCRTAADTSGPTFNVSNVTFPQWLKLVRIGNGFSAYYSANGTAWTQIGQTETLAAPSMMLGGLAVTSDIPSGLSTGTFDHVSVTQPMVLDPAASTPNPVTGTTVTLNVLGDDPNGESSLTYSWSTVGTPPSAVTFSDNGDNTAKSTTAAFSSAGAYNLLVTITDALGLSTTSSIQVVVEQTVTAISVSPTSASLNENGSQQLTAAAFDQFGAAFQVPPAFNWTVNNGPGSVNGSGLFNASSPTGSATVSASSGSIVGTASVTITNAPPTVAMAATASSSPVTGATANLSVLGADDGGESNLKYTWTVVGTPSAPVSFSTNGDNAAKSTTVTFNGAGDYEFQVTITDAGGLSTTSNLTLTVDQTPATVVIKPTGATVFQNQSVHFTATGYDQFGILLATQPQWAWSVSTGAGTIDSAGLYTASSVAEIDTITASISNSPSNPGGLAGDTVPVTVNAIPQPPVLSGIETTPAAYTQGRAAIPLTSTIDVADLSSTTLSAATVQISGNYQNGQDILSFTDTPSISGTWDPTSGTLHLAGTDTVTAYQSALRAVTYSNSSSTPSTLTRTVSFTTSDGSLSSNTTSRDLTVIPLLPPVITSNGGGSTASISIPERTTTVTTVTSTESDGGTPVYSIAGGADASLFTIDTSSGALKFISAPSYSAPLDVNLDNIYHVEVKVSGGNAGSVTQDISVQVSPVPQAPTVASQSFSVSDQSLLGAIVGTITATGSDGDAIRYSVIGNGGPFQVDTTTGRIGVGSVKAIRNSAGSMVELLVRISDAIHSDLYTDTTIRIAISKTSTKEGAYVAPPKPSFPAPANSQSGSAGFDVPGGAAISVAAQASPAAAQQLIGSAGEGENPGDAVAANLAPPQPDPAPAVPVTPAEAPSVAVAIAKPPMKLDPPAAAPPSPMNAPRAASVVPATSVSPKAESPIPTPGLVRSAPLSLAARRAQLESLGQSGPMKVTPINKAALERGIEELEESESESFEAEVSRVKLKVGLASTLGGGIASVYVIWLIRSGTIAASFLSSVPMWRFIDPLFVLPQSKRNRLRWFRRRHTNTPVEAPEEQLFHG